MFVVFCVLLLFFCFKQKTAYEMRIMDWSSDVCSSDLVTSAVGRPPVKESALMKVDADTLKIEASVTPAADKTSDKGQIMAVYGVAVDEIGRASCRERVCQYV